ncbi:OmpA family protein [Limibacter armeniacum]|uniref:OmpA family protein n=1 Tax=Limibacter armeniacum TaxID=466084 RepID=UPI002FE53F82
MRKIPFILILLMLILTSAVQAQYPSTVQWADTVLGVSSEYIVAENSQQYRAVQVLGKPNKLPDPGASFTAWSPAEKSNKEGEWIKVGFRHPVAIQQIAIAENYNPGAVQRIYLYDMNGGEHLEYEKKNLKSITMEGRMFRILLRRPTNYRVQGLKLVLNTEAVPGFNHIDAIGISEDRDVIEPKINIQEGLYEDEDKVVVERLGGGINTKYDEALPVISPDGKELYFTRKDHPINFGDKKMDDIWFAELDQSGKKEPYRLPAPLNDKNHNFVCSVSADGKALLLGNVYNKGGEATGGVSISYRKQDGSWTFPEKQLIKDYYNNSKYSEFNLSSDQKIMLLAIERDDSFGDRDIYVCFRQPNGLWTSPKNLGKGINTASTELTPFLAADGKTLYFSSMGYSGFGMTDMYVARRLDDSWTRWTEPVNLGPEFNSPNWDAGYTVEASGKYAYYVSYRNSKSSGADIYRATLPKGKQPQPVVILEGRVIDGDTGSPVEAEVFYEKLGEEKSKGIGRSSASDGTYKIILPIGEKYAIWANSKGYISQNEMFDLTDVTNYKEVEKDLRLTLLDAGRKLTLKNVFFGQSEHNLLSESFPELNRLVKLFEEYPTVEVVLEGHTDLEGNPFLNMELSEKRVQEVKKYLIEHGVDTGRISTKAFGSTQPLSRERTEEAKQNNRRVEVRIKNI